MEAGRKQGAKHFVLLSAICVQVGARVGREADCICRRRDLQPTLPAACTRMLALRPPLSVLCGCLSRASRSRCWSSSVPSWRLRRSCRWAGVGLPGGQGAGQGAGVLYRPAPRCGLLLCPDGPVSIVNATCLLLARACLFVWSETTACTHNKPMHIPGAAEGGRHHLLHCAPHRLLQEPGGPGGGKQGGWDAGTSIAGRALLG